MEFVTGVAASIIAGLILLCVTAVLSPAMRVVLISALSRYLDVDVEHTFASQRDAATDVMKDVHGARFVWFMGGRGNELQRETFAPMFSDTKDIRVMLPDPGKTAHDIDWIDDRTAELKVADPAFDAELLRTQIQTTVAFLKRHTKTGIQVRLYRFPHLGRIIITSRAAYLTPYREGLHGRDCPVMKYRAGGNTYEFLRRLFVKVWLASRDAYDNVLTTMMRLNDAAPSSS